ncbi:MAG TPA: AlkA N-terminal domain-containing protein [Vicinamibacterales bacterium]|jgi:AraC family transcriptional regulator of adaptative response / DNA-3-methyladenine glycosylase II
MQIDRATCRQARLARDVRFDGRFFIGVRTTGVFCRPICPAVSPAERNVDYYPTAAAAAEAGFRACLRCRPECAPGTPAWVGDSTTVGRALRLIGDGALEAGGVEKLAERLGVGDRHLRRLFVEHLGASPIAVAQTRRLLSAKRLIDETDMPLTAIAMSAGYGSIRRFNAAFLGSYGRSPRELREARTGRGVSAQSVRPRLHGGSPPRYLFQLRYRPPFDWDALLGFLAPRAIPGVESVMEGSYRRTFQIGDDVGWLEVASRGVGALRLTIDISNPAHLLLIVTRVRRMLDLDADPMAIDGQLGRDALLGPLVKRRPGLRVPGTWDGFELGVRAIFGQQVSVAAATTLAGRLVAAFGRPLPREVPGLTHTFPSPEVLADARAAEFGVPATRGEAIGGFARAVANGELSFGGEMDPAVFRVRVRLLFGIGEWTAEYMALRALGDPDAFPSGDLGLLKAAKRRSARELAALADAWRPWRAYAAMHLWTAGGSRV